MAKTEEPPDEFPIERIGLVHGIAADLFVPFAIHRLTRTTGEHACELDVELVGIGDVAHAVRRLRITWKAESVLDLPPGVQQNVVTEWAALGVAAAVVWQYAGVRIETAADSGDCFDFWVMDGERIAGLEVSGTLAADLKTRRREKTRQLLNNPHGIDGYVAVVRFDRAAVSVSFHRQSKVVP